MAGLEEEFAYLVQRDFAVTRIDLLLSWKMVLGGEMFNKVSG